jgi:hypothetical protein
VSVLSPLADACPQCHPGDYPAVLPFLVTQHEGSLRAWYKHKTCGTSWSCGWDAETAGWPLSRDLLDDDACFALLEPVTPEQAAHNRHVLERELDLYDRYHRGVGRRSAA